MKSKAWFFMLPYEVVDNPDFARLSRAALLILMLLCRKFKKYNNGNIALGVREAAAWCHCGQMSACRGFKDLEAAGFITCTLKGHMVPEPGRPDVASQWRINFLKEITSE